MKRSSTLVLLFALVIGAWMLAVAAPRAIAVTLYASTGGGGDTGDAGLLYKIDTDTHVVTFVGATGLSRLGAIAFNVNGVLYGVDGGSQGLFDPDAGQFAALYVLDPSTAGATFIANIVGVGGVDALRFNGAGSLYGAAFKAPTSRLVTIDPATGTVLTAVTLTGSGNAFPSGLAFASDGALYGSRGNSVGRLEDLVLINLATGGETAIGSMTNVISDIWFNSDGTLYAGSPTGDLFRINRATGAKTLLFNTGIRIAGLAGIPELDTDGDGVPDSRDNCPFDFNPDQADRDGDGVGDVCDTCPLDSNPRNPETGQQPNVCALKYNETLSGDTGPKRPGEPIWRTATFANTSGKDIITIKPDCVTTTFTVTATGGDEEFPVILPQTIREKMYGIPNDLVVIPPGPFSVTCDLSEMFDPSVLNSAACGNGCTLDATYANDIKDRDFDPVTGACAQQPCFDVWTGVETSPPGTVTIQGTPVQRDTAQVTFNPAGWFPEWATTPGPAIAATISMIRTPDQTLVDVCSVDPATILLNGTVHILPGSAVFANCGSTDLSLRTLTVKFDRSQAVQTMGSVSAFRRPGASCQLDASAAVQGGFVAPSADIFVGRGAVQLAQESVQIDIKPGTSPNSINLGSTGVVPVAILSSDTFDATKVDPASVTLAGAIVKLKGSGAPIASFQDVNGDGRLDLVVQVVTQSLNLTSGDTQALLQGKTFDGATVCGVDSVRIVK
jgi:Thrombospondin type 3 repeat